MLEVGLQVADLPERGEGEGHVAVLGPEGAALNVERLAQELLGAREVALPNEGEAQADLAAGQQRVIGTEHARANLNRLAVQGEIRRAKGFGEDAFDRLGKVFMGAIFVLAMIFTAGPASFYILRFLLGVAEAGFFPGAAFYLSQWFPPEYRARILAWFLLGIPASTVVGRSGNSTVRLGEPAASATSEPAWMNLVTENTGGLLIFDLPGNVVIGRDVWIHDNNIVANNEPNFAASGTTVSQIPRGTGTFALASRRLEINNNTYANNNTTDIAILSGLAINSSTTAWEVPLADVVGSTVGIALPSFRPGVVLNFYTSEVWVHDNLHSGTGGLLSPSRYFFDDKLLLGAGFVDWHPYKHPLFGDVEIGGFKKDVGRVPPSFLEEEMLHRNYNK